MLQPAEIRNIHDLPFPELIYRSATTHRVHWDPVRLQLCTLDSLRTGACTEDCAYCAQSAHHDAHLISVQSAERSGHTRRTETTRHASMRGICVPTEALSNTKPNPLKDRESVLAGARQAKASGSTRYCMATSGRRLEEGPDFEAVLDIIQEVRAMGLEACVSLGLINELQAKRLKEAGCTVYNHNLDTSRLMYGCIVSTHSFDERLATIRAVRDAGLQVCCGGILGLGETVDDRVHFLHELSLLNPPPEAIPINVLVPILGTPLGHMPPVPAIEVIRVIATARILFPTSRIRLAAGRNSLSPEAQALAFFCGANSIFTGEKLLTTPGTPLGTDRNLLGILGMKSESV